jgi:hypothetical protein
MGKDKLLTCIKQEGEGLFPVKRNQHCRQSCTSQKGNEPGGELGDIRAGGEISDKNVTYSRGFFILRVDGGAHVPVRLFVVARAVMRVIAIAALHDDTLHIKIRRPVNAVLLSAPITMLATIMIQWVASMQ